MNIYRSILDDDEKVFGDVCSTLPISSGFIDNYKFLFGDGFVIERVKRHGECKSEEWNIKFKGVTKITMNGYWNKNRTHFDNVMICGYKLQRDYDRERETLYLTGKKSKKIYRKTWCVKGNVKTEGEIIEYFNKYKIII